MYKKLIVFVLSLFCFVLIPVTAFAEDYGEEYPTYIEYSGGAYIEVQSALGRGSFVFQDTFKTGYFGFFGNDYNLCNISGSTINGRFITDTGELYNIHFSSFNTAQYLYENGMTREWKDLTVTKIFNTNCQFIDNTDLNRGNVIDVYDNDSYKYTVVCCLFSLILLLFIDFIVLKRSI